MAFCRLLLESLSQAIYNSGTAMMNRLMLIELEQYIAAIDASRYARERNYVGGSTKLSEYISRGFISLPRVRDLLLTTNDQQSAYKLLNELAWREYWQLTWRVRGDAIFDYIRPLNYQPRQGLPVAVLEARTGIAALDDGIRELYETGYIHNHLRLWIAGLVCNIAKCDWKFGADWMHSYLIDGDYASNHLSWQWVAGSYTGSAYLPQQDNINTFTRTVQKNTYLDYPYEYLADMEIPAQLQAITDIPTRHESTLPAATITLEALEKSDTLLLYSPWTLDPLWRAHEPGQRLLVLPAEIYVTGAFSQNVLDSITHFSQAIPGIETIYLTSGQLNGLKAPSFRKDYPGISAWPGTVSPPELMYPGVQSAFYPSFSAFWKQAHK